MKMQGDIGISFWKKKEFQSFMENLFFSDLFETDNVVVCQYDKITRARNKWKFHLKVNHDWMASAVARA